MIRIVELRVRLILLLVQVTMRHLQSLILNYPTIYYHLSREQSFILYFVDCILAYIMQTWRSGVYMLFVDS